MLLETLKFAYLKRYLDQFKSSHQIMGMMGQDVVVLPNAPELLSFKYLNSKNADHTILYPDPPLSQAECDILDLVAAGTKMVTPAWVYAHADKIGRDKLLQGRKIGLSIGKPDQDEILRRGFSDLHQDDMVIEFVRYFFSGGARVVYGGNLMANGYTIALIELAEGYHSDERSKAPLISYLHWPYYLLLQQDRKARLQGTVRFEALPPDPIFNVKLDTAIADFGPKENIARAIAGSLSRSKMSETEDARVCIGGKLRGFEGFFPGILEEAYNTVKAGKPLYLLGAWGGCAGAICDMLETGVVPEAFKDRTSQSAALQQSLLQERQTYSGKVPMTDTLPNGSEEMAKEILKAGIAGLRNGLTDDENRQLFHAVHVPEMVGLVLKGLSFGKLSQ
jgi:hypothetical protein